MTKKPKGNTNEMIETLSNWTDEEQQILEQNLITFPADKYSEFKRLALLLTNLKTKKLRDVSLRLQYMKSINPENKSLGDVNYQSNSVSSFNPNLTWEEFVKNVTSPRSKSERLRRESPVSSERNNYSPRSQLSPRSPRSMKEMSESPIESPRMKKKVYSIHKNPTPPTSSKGNRQSASQNQQIKQMKMISQKERNESKESLEMKDYKEWNSLIDDNEKIIERIGDCVLNKREIDINDVNNMYSNIHHLMNITDSMGNGELPNTMIQPVVVSEQELMKSQSNDYKNGASIQLTVHHNSQFPPVTLNQSMNNSMNNLQPMNTLNTLNNVNKVNTLMPLNHLQSIDVQNQYQMDNSMNQMYSQPMNQTVNPNVTPNLNNSLNHNSSLNNTMNTKLNLNLNQNMNQNIQYHKTPQLQLNLNLSNENDAYIYNYQTTTPIPQFQPIQQIQQTQFPLVQDPSLLVQSQNQQLQTQSQPLIPQTQPTQQLMFKPINQLQYSQSFSFDKPSPSMQLQPLTKAKSATMLNPVFANDYMMPNQNMNNQMFDNNQYQQNGYDLTVTPLNMK